MRGVDMMQMGLQGIGGNDRGQRIVRRPWGIHGLPGWRSFGRVITQAKAISFRMQGKTA